MTVAKIQWLKINRGAVGEEIHRHAAIVDALNSSVGEWINNQSMQTRTRLSGLRSGVKGHLSFFSLFSR